MSEKELKKIADNAKIIVNGYAFSKREDGFISILNLEHPDCAIVISHDFEVIETNMDEIEQGIVIELAKKNLQFLEEENA